MAGPELVLELRIATMAAGGAAVARADDGRVVFVRHTLPGEVVRAKVTGETPSYLRADAVEILEAARDRVAPPCPWAGPGRCGGCDWQHVALPAQRALAAQVVSDQLARLAGIERQVEVEEVPGAPDGLGWRTRVTFAVDGTGRAGLLRHRSHHIEPIDHCLIAAPGVEAVGAEHLTWPGRAQVEVVASADGAQRVVSVRSARGRPGTAAGRPGTSADRRGTAAGRRGDRPGWRGARPALPAVDAGLVADGQPGQLPHGVRHVVLGRPFEVAAGVFWQVHPGAAAALARAVLDGLAPRPGERALDLYAGAGLFAALLGDAVGPAGSVLAVEGDRRAAADASRNTADLPQVSVRTAAVTPALVAKKRADLVVLDPPRAGAGRAAMAALAQLRPRRMAYVACDTASFARDLRVLLDAGWTMPSLRAFDLFPMTHHVELVAVLDPPEP